MNEAPGYPLVVNEIYQHRRDALEAVGGFAGIYFGYRLGR